MNTARLFTHQRMWRLSRCLRGSLSTSATSRQLAPTISLATPDASLSREQSTEADGIGAAGSRIYILGRRREREVEVSEALRGLRAGSMAASPETVAVNIKVDMTLKKGKKREPFKGPVALPHTFGQERIVLFVSESAYHDTALEAGADRVAADEIFSELEEDAVNFDVCLTTPTMLDRFKPLQRKLKSKMPNVRRGTVVEEDNITQAIRELKTRREFKCDKVGHILVPVGKLDFPDEHIVENISSLLRSVASHHGNLPKTSFVQKVLLTSTYGPAFPVRTRRLL